MKLSLNLATAPQPNNRPFLAGAAICGLVAVVMLLMLAHAEYQSYQANRELRAEVARWQGEIRVYKGRQQVLEAYFHTPAAEQVLQRSIFLNSLIDERSFPWTKVFMDLEQTLPPGVRVITITPELVNGRAEVTLEVGAMSDAAKLEFLEAVERSKTFSGLVVKSERQGSTTAQAPDKVFLNLTVWYSTT